MATRVNGGRTVTENFMYDKFYNFAEQNGFTIYSPRQEHKVENGRNRHCV